MAFLKHPDSSRILRASRNTAQYDRLCARGYTEVSKPAPGVQVTEYTRADRRYPLRRPHQDLQVMLHYSKEFTPEEVESIKKVIAILDNHITRDRNNQARTSY